MTREEQAYAELIARLLGGTVQTPDDLQKAKLEVCRKHALDMVPRNSELLARLDGDARERLIHILRKKPTRTMSGVAIVAVMTSPADCPHGKCTYCPGGVVTNSAQSYTGNEPAALRAGQHAFDSYRQTRDRLTQLERIGHPVDKIELIIMGGTFPARDPAYQTAFIQGCFDAMNNAESADLEEAQLANETATSRCIGMTIETRPDYCKPAHVARMVSQGCTRVELGVQTVYDDVLAAINRGHTVADSIAATKTAKDAGLKVCYHMMPGLPGSGIERDRAAFDTIFTDPDFKPDLLKIYPALVIGGTTLYEQWERGDYAPIETDEAVRLLAEIKKSIPPWVRIQRIQRDIPVKHVAAGIKKSDVRALVQNYLDDHGGECRCVRCREVGQRFLKNGVLPDERAITLTTTTYSASRGTEYFIAFEEQAHDILIGYCRMRIPSPHSPLDERGSALIRELHVFGPMLPVGAAARNTQDWQHRGYGEELLKEAERLAADVHQKTMMTIISGVGARPYYRKFGYERDGPYMARRL